MRNKTLAATGWLLVALMVAVVAGCTSDNPMIPADRSTANGLLSSTLDGQPPCENVQFSATIATIDYDLQSLTFEDADYTATVPEDCPIYQVQNGDRTEITFADLNVGDFVKVCGVVLEDGTVEARLVILYPGGVCIGYDLSFQDTLATIDYGAGTFTVKGRSETLMIDDNTVIWGKLPYNNNQAEGNDKDGYSSGNIGDNETSPYLNRNRHAVDTIFTFTDLQPGYLLEIKANIVDETTLLAVDIKVLGCNFRESVQFEASIATIDYETGEVTFDGYDWLGTVCPGAALIDAEGGTLTLADFAVGDNVLVKGVPLAEEPYLKICAMTML